MNITVRPINDQDLSWLIAADQDFPHPWKDDAWHSLSPYMHGFIAWLDGQAIGFSLFHHLTGDHQAHLLKIYLQPHHRSRGVAQTLFTESLSRLKVKEVFLEVAESNVVAQKFYEKMGFVKTHLAKGFYSSGENAWLMLLTT